MLCLGEGLGSNALRNSSYTETMISASFKTLVVEKQKIVAYSMLPTC